MTMPSFSVSITCNVIVHLWHSMDEQQKLTEFEDNIVWGEIN